MEGVTKLYIVNATIRAYPYMNNSHIISDGENFIVRAISSEEAEEKLFNKYKAMDSEYSITYGVEVNYINEEIL